MNREPKLSKALLKPINTAAIILLGAYTIVWGFWLANPFWDVFTSAAIYSKMAQISPDWVPASPEFFWGIIAVIAGLVTCYGAVRPSYYALIMGAGTAFIHWFVIAVFYFWGDWHNTGGITSLTFATYAAFIYLNIRVNYKNGHQDINQMLGR